MVKAFAFLISLPLLMSFKPGVGSATLTCKSASGRTMFIANLDECSSLRTAEFSVDNLKLIFSGLKDNGDIIFDPENKVFTICLNKDLGKGNSEFVKFWAIPSSFKKTLNENGPGSQFHHIYEFRGKIYGREPRANKEYSTPVIEVSCILDYQM